MHGFSGIPLKNLALYFLLFSLKPLIYLGFIFVQQALLTNHKLPITNYQSQITNHKLPITNHQLPITKKR
jgi:hypothetical protein